MQYEKFVARLALRHARSIPFFFFFFPVSRATFASSDLHGISREIATRREIRIYIFIRLFIVSFRASWLRTCLPVTRVAIFVRNRRSGGCR